MTKQPPSADDFNADARTEELIREYLKDAGKRIPETPEEVAAMERLIENEKLEAPERLRNRDIFTCAAPTKVYKMPAGLKNCEATQHLRRAAREGKAISDKVEAQMKTDRANAKRENSGEK